MSYNGSGTFLINTAGQPVVSGTVISSTAFNALTADLATGLSTAITKDGQTTVTANIPMGTYKFTGLGAGTAATDSANLSQVQSTVTKLLASVSGADTITAVGSPTLGAYAAGQMFYFVAAGDNTGAVTLNIDSLGAKSVTRDGSVALAAGDIKSGEVVVVVYDGTRFQVVSQLNSAGNATFANVSITSALNVGGVATVTGGATLNGGVVINEPGADVDFRVEGDTDANLIFADASTDRLGIGTSSPAGKVHAVASSAGTTSLFERSTASTAVPVFASRSLATSSGDMADGFGPTHAFAIQDDAAVINPISEIGAVREGADNSGGLVFRTYSAGTATTQMRLDKAGNLGLGVTPSAYLSTVKAIDISSAGAVIGGGANVSLAANAYLNSSGNWIYKNSSTYAAKYTPNFANNGSHAWEIAASGTAGNTITFTQALTLDASGNLGVGITSPGARLHVSPSANGIATGVRIDTNGATSEYLALDNIDSGVAAITAGSGGSGNRALAFYTAASGTETERARITSGGSFLVGTTTTTLTANHNLFAVSSADWALAVGNAQASPYGLKIDYTVQTPNSTGAEFLYCEDASTVRASIRSNGGLANYQSNNVDLSDARTKNSITPAASMWDKIGALEIVTYKYNDQTHDDVNVGVIAQQVESVEPVWVDADGFGETPEGEEPLKTVYTKDITFAAIKALQEAMARIEKLEAEVAALKGA